LVACEKWVRRDHRNKKPALWDIVFTRTERRVWSKALEVKNCANSKDTQQVDMSFTQVWIFQFKVL
jgi:hypothetical protein